MITRHYTYEYEAAANEHEATAVVSTHDATTHIKGMTHLEAIDVLNGRVPVLHIICDNEDMLYINATHITSIRVVD